MSGNCGTDWNPRPTSSNAFFQVQKEEHSASKRLTKLEPESASRSLPAVPACCCPRTILWSSIQQGKLEQTWIHSHSAARTSSRTMKVGKCSHLNVHSVLCYHTTLRPKSKFRLIKCLGVNLLISLWLLKSLQAVYTKTGWMSQVAFNRDIWCQQKCVFRKKRHFWERCFSCYFNMSPKTV